MFWRVCPPASAFGTEVRAVGLDQDPLERQPRRDVSNVGRLLVGEITGERDSKAEVPGCVSQISASDKAMEDAGPPSEPWRPFHRREIGQHVVVGLAIVNDDRPLQLGGKLELHDERSALHGRIGILTIVVQTNLTDRHDFRMSRQRAKRR